MEIKIINRNTCIQETSCLNVAEADFTKLLFSKKKYRYQHNVFVSIARKCGHSLMAPKKYIIFDSLTKISQQ